MNKFVIWDPKAVRNGAAVVDLLHVDRVWAMMDGESFQQGFPADAAFEFNPDFKRNTLLVDCPINIENMMLTSGRLKEFVERRSPEALEYLPVTVFDHKRKPVDQPYFILHPVDPPDCIDFAQSQVTWSQQDPSSLQFADKLVIDEAKVPQGRLVFRPKAYPGALLVRRDFAMEIEQAGFSGAGWREIK